ncbi:MAG: Ig-like domain-containing protein [Gemmatimonadota bacterium]|nr:Ig-like domain-containing protein [Gemmatimonadota bacterium]
MNGKTNRYRTLGFASALVAALIGGVSCGGDGTTDPPPPPPPPPPAPVAPVAVGSIPAQVMTVGQTVTVDVTPFFRDPDGGALTYTAASSATAVLTVSLTGSNLTLTAVAPGTATVTVTATDPGGLTATQSAGVTVEAANQAPEAVGTIPAQTMSVGQTATVDVSAFFSDPDGDALTYTAESSDEAAVTAGLEGSSLTLTAVAVGTATVTVTAADPDGLTAMQSAEVTVTAANQAPEAVGTIPAQTMSVGQTATVDVSAFFTDPDGDALTYAAESSSEAAVAAGLEGSSLTLTAVATGTATLTVTATDPGGLSATQSAEVTVTAANQAPEPVGAIPAQAMSVGGTATVDVSAFFTDPDGDELSYEVESSDARVVSVALSGSRLTLTAVSAGTATVTATATDPGGLSATQSAEVTVAASAGFRDDFDSAASLDDWEISSADASVADGILRLTPTTDDRLGLAERPLEPALTEWTIRARMGRATSEGTVRVYWLTGDADFPALGFSLGPVGEHNFRFLFFDAEDGGWFFTSSLAGNSDAVRDEPGEFTDLTIGHDGAQVFMAAGETELLRFTPTASFRPALQSVTELWLVGTENRSAVHFDWVHVTGTESSAAMSSATKAARDRVGHAVDATERRLDEVDNKP